MPFAIISLAFILTLFCLFAFQAVPIVKESIGSLISLSTFAYFTYLIYLDSLANGVPMGTKGLRMALVHPLNRSLTPPYFFLAIKKLSLYTAILTSTLLP
jgi:hypothetical protein